MELKQIQHQTSVQPFTGENDRGNELVSLRSVIETFLEFSSSHGITHVHRSKELIRRAFWGFMTVAGLVCLGLHLYLMISGYIQFDVNTNIDTNDARSLTFPAVTVCNNNGVRRSVAPPSIMDEIQSRRADVINGTEDRISSSDLLQAIKEALAILTYDQKQGLGHQVEDFIIYCTFAGDNCNSTDFWTFFHPTYGNCYTFNSGQLGGVIVSSTQAGPIYGLTMVLSIGEYEYMPYITEDLGITVVVHPQYSMPFPDHSGVSAQPGNVNNLGLTQVSYSRLGSKYSNCTSTDIPTENMYAHPYNMTYTEWSCLKTCLQKELVSKCGCFDPGEPYDPLSEVFIEVAEATEPCITSNPNSTTASCYTEVTDLFADGSLLCELCVQPCTEYMYHESLSSSKYPADTFLSDFKDRLSKTHPSLISTYAQNYGANEIDSAIATNILKLNVYYKTMLATEYAQYASYDDFQFVSDLGGAFGLWIGWSVLTFFEFFELLVDMLGYACYRNNRKVSSKEQSTNTT